jgi:hypothetical protein
MSRNYFPNSISYDSSYGKDIFILQQKEMLDVNILNTHKEQRGTSQIKRISRKLFVSFFYLKYIT